MSAGCLLIQEAGGRAGSTRGEDYNVRVLDTIGTNGMIHDEMLRVLKEAHADRVDSSDCDVCFGDCIGDASVSHYFRISAGFTPIIPFLLFLTTESNRGIFPLESIQIFLTGFCFDDHLLSFRRIGPSWRSEFILLQSVLAFANIKFPVSTFALLLVHRQ